jgi:uncharacterized protein (TIGR02271 family)
MSHEKIVALYDTVAHANAAVNTLRMAGYPSADISVIKNDGDAKAGWSEPWFWQGLFGEDITPHEADVYGRSLRQGGAVVAVRVTESEAPKVIELLDSHKPIDVVDRARSYAASQAPSVAVPPPTMAPPQAATTPVATTGTTPLSTLKKDEEVVRLAEEELNVGKRRIESGKTRVRRLVVERPVEANVTLHEEHIEVMRRALSEPGILKDADWSEQVFEVTDILEQPVVSKTARVIEEVVIRRKGSDHVETVRDTVRRQQLDVEKLPLETVKK